MDAHLWPLLTGALGLLLVGIAVFRWRASAAARRAVRLAVEHAKRGRHLTSLVSDRHAQVGHPALPPGGNVGHCLIGPAVPDDHRRAGAEIRRVDRQLT